MPIKKDESGRRYVEVEVEVPGTPEQVWEAIASGPGISSWFVPTTVEKDAGGKPVRILMSFGPGMDSVAKVTSWNPPRELTAESEWLGPGAPPIATEWIVEARGGGTCVVRVVHSLFASTDEWDNQLQGSEDGWPAFFRLLRIYLAHFAGQPCSAFQLTGWGPEPKDAAWAALMGSLGLSGKAVGEEATAGSAAPPVAGTVERTGEALWPEELILRLHQPTPGIAHFFAMPMGGQILLSVRIYLYGPRSDAAAKRDEPVWQAWMSKHFPASGGGAGTCGP